MEKVYLRIKQCLNWMMILQLCRDSTSAEMPINPAYSRNHKSPAFKQVFVAVITDSTLKQRLAMAV